MAQASKTILWQFKELLENPVVGINAAPLENNLNEWHGNIYFPDTHEWYHGLVAHFILTLPSTFPNDMPELELVHSFRHSHVFGSNVCFSLFTAFQSYFKATNTPQSAYWHPGRTVRSLLEDLYQFLTVDEDQHVRLSKEARGKALRNAEMPCTTCGHCSLAPWPPEDDWLAATSQIGSDKLGVSRIACYRDLAPSLEMRQLSVALEDKPVDDILSEIGFKMVQIRSEEPRPNQKRKTLQDQLDAMTVTVATLDNLSSVPLRVEDTSIQDLRCNVFGLSYWEEPEMILGFGVQVTYRPDRTILSIETDLEPLSLRAFQTLRVRRSTLGMDFQYFLPFAINSDHFQRARPFFIRTMNEILRQCPSRSDVEHENVGFVIGELWKSMAVQLMKGETHASEKVLKGFCAFHHLLLHFAELQPSQSCHEMSLNRIAGREMDSDGWCTVQRKKRQGRAASPEPKRSSLQSWAETTVRRFLNNPDFRHKSKCPDFGRFLPLILLTNISWQQMSKVFMEEQLSRCSLWIAKAYPELSTVGPRENRSARLEKSWRQSKAGLRLTAFQVSFMNQATGWARSYFEKEDKTNSTLHLNLLSMYDELGGFPTRVMLEEFHVTMKFIQSAANYKTIFQLLDLPVSNLEVAYDMLCKAMRDSAHSGYHRPKRVSKPSPLDKYDVYLD